MERNLQDVVYWQLANAIFSPNTSLMELTYTEKVFVRHFMTIKQSNLIITGTFLKLSLVSKFFFSKMLAYPLITVLKLPLFHCGILITTKKHVYLFQTFVNSSTLFLLLYRFHYALQQPSQNLLGYHVTNTEHSTKE